MNAGTKRGIWSRRDFFTRIGWGGIGIFSLLSILGFLRAAFPRVLFLPPATFNAGLPSEYALNDVGEKYKQDERVWIIREEEGIYVLFAKCTHLGYTPRWLAVEDKIQMPVPRQRILQIGNELRRTGAAAVGPLRRLIE